VNNGHAQINKTVTDIWKWAFF